MFFFSIYRVIELFEKPIRLDSWRDRSVVRFALCEIINQINRL